MTTDLPDKLEPAKAAPRPADMPRPTSAAFEFFDRTLESPYMRGLLYQYQATRDGQ